MATKPWRPASLLHVINKDPNFVYRWVREDNMEKAMLEGREPVRSTNKNGESAPFITLSDGTRIDGVVRKRRLILCKMPREMAEARDNYYQERTNMLLESTTAEYESRVAGEGSKPYGQIQIIESGRR